MEEKTQKITDHPKYDPIADLRKRMSTVEYNYIVLDTRLSQLTVQILNSQLKRGEVDRDMAESNVDRLEKALREIDQRTEELGEQITSEDDATRRLVLEMMLDQTNQRKTRVSQERDAAAILLRKSNELVDDSSKKIKAIKMGPETAIPMQPIQSTADRALKRIWDRLEPIVISGSFLILLRALWEYFRSQVSPGP